MSKKIPPIQLLSAIHPEERGGQLVSPRVHEEFDAHKDRQSKAWKRLLESEPGSLKEKRASRWLAKFSLLEASKKLAASPEERRSLRRDIWARRFTQASTELYAPPEIRFVERILKREIERLESQASEYSERVADFYEAALDRISTSTSESTTKELSSDDYGSLSSCFRTRYKEWFDFADREDREEYKPQDLEDIFTKLIDIASTLDMRWSDWTCKLDPRSDIVRVRPSRREVLVGARRVSATHRDMLGLVAHELGVHAARSVNGEKEDDSLRAGLSGYIEIEESLGILSEAFINGDIPDKAKDRYVDIAFAMGAIKGVQLSRDELSALALDRALGRLHAEGDEITSATICRELERAKTHVNRIFRGGDGLEGAFAAVFTKDAIYYPARLEDYIKRKLLDGHRAEEILDFLLQGKFDPMNDSHLEYMQNIGIETL